MAKFQDSGNGMTLHFRGIDSEDGTLSMEYLEDVLKFGKALKALSKDLYVHKSGKKRAPAGFKGIDFNMSGLNIGSTIVKFRPLNYDFGGPQLADDTFDIITRHLSGKGIDMSNYDGLSDYDPSEVIKKRCNGLWADLDEKVSLQFSNRGKEYTFDRQFMSKTSITRRDVSKETSIIGSVYEMDCNNQRFKMQFIDNKGKERSASIHFKIDDEGSIIESLKNRSTMKIRVTGKDLPISDMKDIESSRIKLLLSTDSVNRLEEIIKIATKRIKNDSELERYISKVRFLETLIESNYTGCSSPSIYPTPDNDLEFEWQDNDYVMVLNLETMNAEIIGQNEDDDYSLDLNLTESWKKLCELISDEPESQ